MGTRHLHRSGSAVAVAAALVAVTIPGGAVAAGHAHTATTTAHSTYTQVDLVSDQPGKAAITDPNLVNAWGMSRGPHSPVWVSNFGTSTSTLYNGANGSAPVNKVPLTVAISGGPPTGQVFNDTQGFTVPGTGLPARFIFAGVGGALSAWNGGTSAVQVAHVNRAAYSGLTMAHSPFGPLLLGADFHDGRIDVFDASFTKLRLGRLFLDPLLPRGYAPFDVAEVGGYIAVAYAQQSPDRTEDVAGPGHGVVDLFTTYGAFIRRMATGGVLNSPWGLTIAPASFGDFSGDLLVGNFGDGRIHAFDPKTGALRGTLMRADGHPVAIPGLWGLLVGDDVAGGPDALWFSAGPDGEKHGLVGTLRVS